MSRYAKSVGGWQIYFKLHSARTLNYPSAKDA